MRGKGNISTFNAYVVGQDASLVLLAHQHGHILLHIHRDARLLRIADPQYVGHRHSEQSLETQPGVPLA